MRGLGDSWRRLVGATLIMAGVLGGGLERLLPDVHDGDGSGSATFLAGAESHAPAPTHDPASPHICHCLHVHVADLSVATMTELEQPATVTHPTLVMRRPPSAPLSPALRPPIA